MNSLTKPEEIVATLVDDENRLDFLPTFFGPRFMLHGETLIYAWMRKLCSAYNGGYWKFYTLSNGAWQEACLALPMAGALGTALRKASDKVSGKTPGKAPSKTPSKPAGKAQGK